MHDQTKQMFLEEHHEKPEYQSMIEAISVPGYEFIPKINERRFIKTHLPFSLMPPSVMEERAKIVYVARNPKDVIVSYYHLSRLYRTTGYVNDFETFWEYFEKDLGKEQYFRIRLRAKFSYLISKTKFIFLIFQLHGHRIGSISKKVGHVGMNQTCYSCSMKI